MSVSSFSVKIYFDDWQLRITLKCYKRVFNGLLFHTVKTNKSATITNDPLTWNHESHCTGDQELGHHFRGHKEALSIA